MEEKNYDIETRISFITKLDEDVVRVEVKKDIEVELNDLEENYNSYLKLFGKKPLYFLVIFNVGSDTSREVQNQFAKECSSFKEAEAIVVNSLPHKIVANFILKIQKPAHIMQVFNDEQSALDWLFNQRLKDNYKEL